MADDASKDGGASGGPKAPDYDYGSADLDSTTYGARDPEHQRALERLQMSAEAYNDQIEREKADLRFQVPDLMWSKEARGWRDGETIGDITIPPRPIVSIPKLEQPVQLVLNQERSAHLGVSFHPLDERSNDETADVQTGIYRTIERLSRAGLARSWAFERAVKAGRGGWRVVTVPADNYAVTKDQDIRIQRMLFQESAFPDPFAIEPDWSDGEFLLILEWMSFRKYQRLTPKGRRQRPDGTAEDFPSVLAGLTNSDLTKLQLEAPAWIRGDGEARAILTGEYMYLEDRPADEKKAAADGWRQRETRRVCWRRLNPIEFTDFGIIHSRWIPWVPTIGKELIPFDDERRWTGMYGPNKDGQNVFNYSASTAVEAMAQEPRNTLIMAEGQEVGHERELLLMNTRNFPYVRYTPKALGGELLPEPKRQQADTSRLGLSIQMLTMANDWLHSGTAFFDPSLGKSSPNVRTRGGTLALQQQGDESNSHWLDNQVEISMAHEARIIASMIPYYYDRPGRVMRLLGRLGEPSDTSKTVMLNQPYVEQKGQMSKLPYTHPEDLAKLGPGQRPQAQAQNDATMQAVQDPSNPAKFYNLLDGIYGTATSIGKGYKARVDQGADELGQLFQAEPELFKILGDLYLQFRDFPGHEEAAKRVKKLLPPQLQDQDGQQDPAMQLEQAKQAMQAMQAEIQKLQPEQLKYQAQVQIAGLKEKTAQMGRLIDVKLQQMKDATQLAVARINQKAEGEQLVLSADLEAEATGLEHAHEAAMAAADRAHEAAMAAAGAGAAQDGADAQRAHEMASAAAGAGEAAASQASDQAAASAESEAGRAHEADQAGLDREAAQVAAVETPGAEPAEPAQT